MDFLSKFFEDLPEVGQSAASIIGSPFRLITLCKLRGRPPLVSSIPWNVFKRVLKYIFYTSKIFSKKFKNIYHLIGKDEV